MKDRLKNFAAYLYARFMLLPRRRRLRIGVITAIVLFIWWFIPPVWRLRSGPITITRWPKSGEKEFVIGPGQPTWVPIKRVSKHVINAFIAAEDGKFYTHNGFDVESIMRSYEANKKQKKIVRGGSTISQQVVKMAFLSNDRTYIRKAREAVGTVLLERLLTKEQILEWYLNMAEFGDGIFGIKSASRHYFDTKPELLTIQHGAHLALVLPSPNKWSKGLRSKHLTEFGQKRYTNIINNMFFAGQITNVLRMTALATGDFGRPVQAFSDIRKKSKSAEPLNYDDEELSKAEEKEEKDDDVLPKAIQPAPDLTAPNATISPPDIEPGPAPSTSPGEEAASGTIPESATPAPMPAPQDVTPQDTEALPDEHP